MLAVCYVSNLSQLFVVKKLAEFLQPLEIYFYNVDRKNGLKTITSIIFYNMSLTGD